MTITEQLRKAIEEAAESRNALAARSHVAPATICRFVRGYGGMSLSSLDRLCEALGLELRPIEKRKEV